MKKDLLQYRNEIDEIDEQIMRLFEKRMMLVMEIAEYKKENNIPIFNKNRENEVIEKNIGRLEDENLVKYAEEMLHYLMDISKKYQCEKLGL